MTTRIGKAWQESSEAAARHRAIRRQIRLRHVFGSIGTVRYPR